MFFIVLFLFFLGVKRRERKRDEEPRHLPVLTRTLFPQRTLMKNKKSFIFHCDPLGLRWVLLFFSFLSNRKEERKREEQRRLPMELPGPGFIVHFMTRNLFWARATLPLVFPFYSLCSRIKKGKESA